MAVSPLIRCGGLATDPNPLLTAAQGGLRVADDIIIERPGVASPRPGWSIVAQQPAFATVPAAIAPAFASYITQEWEGDGAGWGIRLASSAVTGPAEPLDYTISFSQFARARDNVYWTTTKGPQKVSSVIDTDAVAAGMHEATSGLPSVATSGTPVVLPTDSATAWRWCFRKVDANGLITRSPPSPWQTMNNTSGSTIDMSWIIPLPLYVAENDQIELYRSIAVTPSTAVPSDMMYLARTYIVTSADVTAGSVTLRDSTPESALGQELYTNATREGALKANARPPASVALCTWSDCMWFGYVRGPWTTAFDIVTVTGNTSTDGLTGLQRLQRTGDSTNGSPIITNLASTTSIKVGQLVSTVAPGTAPTGFAVPVTVLSKTATTVTVSADATSSNVGATYRFHDGVTIDGITYWAGSTEITSGDYPTFAINVGNREVSTARSLAYVISVRSPSLFAFAIEDPYYAVPLNAFERYTQATVVVRSREMDDAQWAAAFIADTTSDLPAIAFRAAPDGTPDVSRDEFPHGLAYSKPREPEAVPELNFITIGDESAPIRALAPLRAALLVFKRDGIYRVTGTPPDGWRVDLIEPNAQLLRGECVDVLDGKAYAWTERGLLEVDEGGARNVSDGAIGLDLRARASHLFVTPLTTGAFVRAVPRRNLVVVGVPGGNGSAEADYQYVLSTTTRAWTRWTMPLYCAAWLPASGAFYAARGRGWDIRQLSFPYSGETFTGYDGLYTIAAWSVVGATDEVEILIADAGGWVPAAGDWVSTAGPSGTEYRRVLSATDDGTSYFVTISEAFTDADSDLTAYEGIVSKVQWQAFNVGAPAVSLFARELHVMLDWSGYSGAIGGTTSRMLLGASTSLVSTPATQEWTGTRSALPTLDARATIPTAVSRAAHLYPYLETDDIGLDWKCDGVCIVYDGTSEKGVR